jgi:predicted PurR-regulated permease PerM
MAESTGIRKFFANNWEKMALWAIFIGLLLVLKPFLLLIFETFLITYIMKNVAEWVVSRVNVGHRFATVVVFFLFVSFLAATGAWIGPRFVIESKQILTDFAGDSEAQTQKKIDTFINETIQKVLGGGKAQPLRKIGASNDETIQKATEGDKTQPNGDSPDYEGLRTAIKTEVANAAKAALPGIVKGFLHVVKLGWEAMVSLILAIILSFILVLDWQRIAAGMSTLETSRIRTFYVGAAPHLKAFADVLGKAFRAQAIIAACNTILTVIGLWIFDVPNITLLSAIVFICGFIPIAGTFLSSIPILLFGIQGGGLLLAVKLIVLIAIVHAFEAYVLNPRITAGVLHVHPMLVLVLLLAGERFFGIWGMVLGVPLGYYVIKVLTEKDERLDADSS